MTDTDTLHWLSADDVTSVIRQQADDCDVLVIAWTSERLVGAGEALGVWRLAGGALIRGKVREWSIVLKGWGAPSGEDDPAAFNWAHREMELYRSGLLAELPGGIRAPACYGSFRGDDGSIWVWLEDITDGVNGLGSAAEFAMVARQLGQFNGAWATGRPLPEHPALSEGWTRRWVDAAGPSLDRMAQVLDLPLARRLFPPHVFDTYRRVWATRHAGYARLERLPKTFAHLDVFPRNIFVREERDAAAVAAAGAAADVVLIDWSFAGIARIGEELGPLVMASAIFMETAIGTLDDLEETVVEAYLDGLRNAGWRGDSNEVIAAYRVSAALRYGPGIIRIGLRTVLGEWTAEDAEANFGVPFDTFIDHLAGFHEWLAGQIREHEDLFR